MHYQERFHHTQTKYTVQQFYFKMSEVNDDSAVDCNGDGSPARRSSTTTVPLLNTVLSYKTYGMLWATPDNLRHVLCSHFNIDELCDAKDFLWSHCNLADVPKRTNSNKRSVHEATAGDIMNAMYMYKWPSPAWSEKGEA